MKTALRPIQRAGAFLELIVPLLHRNRKSGSPSAELLAAYQSPPTELLIQDGPEWHRPSEVRNSRGNYVVITSDNPASKLFSEKRNAARRARFRSHLEKRAIVFKPTRARDPHGEWPDEFGFALWGLELFGAQKLSRRWGQFAFYQVDEKGVTVIVTERLRLFARR
jgi:Protein of unknown function (DUF3293)